MDNLKKMMMMVLVIELASYMLSPARVLAQEKKKDPVVKQTEQSGKVEIKKEELPEVTKKLLAGSEFKDWTISKVYKVKTKEKDASGKEIEEFEVEVKRADQVQVILFDKEGNLKNKEG